MGWSDGKLRDLRVVVHQASAVVVGLMVFLAYACAHASPITYIFKGTITNGSFEPGGVIPTVVAPAQSAVDLSGGLLTVKFFGDTSQVTPPALINDNPDCGSISAPLCAGGLSNSILVTRGTETLVNGSMNGTFVVISNPSDPTFPFIGFQEVGTDPVLAFDTTGTSLAALPGQKPYGLDTAFDEIMLDVLLPNLGSPFDETLVNNGGHFTISELDASFQATTASSNVPEPGTLALLSLVLGAATLSLHRNRGSRMRLSDQ